MSGFDTRWLDLREPADRSARDGTLLDAARAFLLEAGAAPLAVDLGAGTGSTLRAFGPDARGVRWRLVDNDPRLLAAAIPRLPGFTALEPVEADLGRLSSSRLDGARLVTASALFDLVSRDVVETLASWIADRGAGIYAALSYDGRMAWAPPLPEDAAVVAAFNAHQTGDKGMGPALGPQAADALRTAFASRGYDVRTAPSPWRLGPADAALHDALLDGIRSAVTDTGRIDPQALAAWRARRGAGPVSCEIGHVDVLALPPQGG